MVQYVDELDAAFAAIADRTRRGILERLGDADASISDLAADCEMTLTGVKKHIQVLEDAGLVETEKIGRVRYCRLGPRRLDEVANWIEIYRRRAEQRYRRLDQLLETMPDHLPDDPAPPDPGARP